MMPLDLSNISGFFNRVELLSEIKELEAEDWIRKQLQ